MPYFRSGGVTIHYDIDRPDTGRDGKLVVVFINSLGTDLRSWTDVRHRLAGDCAVIVYDKRGHGLSDIGATPYTIADHAGDLAALLDHLGQTGDLAGRKAVVCGLSVGGQIALGLYAARPDLVEALVLSNTAHKIGSPEMWNARIGAIEAGGLDSILEPVMERWFTPAFRRPDNPAYGVYRNMFLRQPAAGYTATCAAIRDADFTETARRIAVPTLTIAGDQDGATPPELVRSLADLIPGARFALIPDAGHLPGIEQPAAYAAALGGFIAQLPSGQHTP
ncbi:3-oxoadipate enol-lactonase [Pseudochelatococcus sp. B33]